MGSGAVPLCRAPKVERVARPAVRTRRATSQRRRFPKKRTLRKHSCGSPLEGPVEPIRKVGSSMALLSAAKPDRLARIDSDYVAFFAGMA